MAKDTYFPELFDAKGLRASIDNGFDWVIIEWGDTLERMFNPLLFVLEGIEDFLIFIPWYIIILAVFLLSYHATRKLSVSIVLAAFMFCIGLLDLWKEGMETIALMLASTIMCVILGIPMGIYMSRSDRLQNAVLPVLDLMQTVPIFVYLIPFVMVFGPGKIPALLATIVFAIPPVIRLTNLGIRHVDKEICEAVISFGAKPLQKLFKVEMPLAMPTIMAGVNQTTMMALSMVVIASMIGAGGLGYVVLQGIQRLEIGRGILTGLSIAFIAIILDRIAQSYVKKTQQHTHT